MSVTTTARESAKDTVIEAIRQLPDDVSVEDILEALYVRQKIDIGLRQHASGETVSHEEAMKRLGKWLS